MEGATRTGKDPAGSATANSGDSQQDQAPGVDGRHRYGATDIGHVRARHGSDTVAPGRGGRGRRAREETEGTKTPSRGRTDTPRKRRLYRGYASSEPSDSHAHSSAIRPASKE